MSATRRARETRQVCCTMRIGFDAVSVSTDFGGLVAGQPRECLYLEARLHRADSLVTLTITICM